MRNPTTSGTWPLWYVKFTPASRARSANVTRLIHREPREVGTSRGRGACSLQSGKGKLDRSNLVAGLASGRVCEVDTSSDSPNDLTFARNCRRFDSLTII